ncbi:MAG: hypothetical protein ACLT3H_01965 [Roseburia sp.]
MKEKKIAVRDIALIGMMIAALETAKLSLSFLPNVELVTLLIILYTLFFGWRIFYVMPAFILIEGCLYGFGTWWVMYAYIWPLLAVLAWLFRKKESVWFWSVFSGAYGLFFGALCSVFYFFVGGPKMAFVWWVAGIPYDLIHCASNAVLCAVLFLPLSHVMGRFGAEKYLRK